MTKSPDSVALRAFSVLEYVVHAGAPVSLEVVTQATGLPKPTAFRILALLQGAGLLAREAVGKRWTLGPRMGALALDLWRQSTLHSVWQAALQAAVDATGESCNFTIREGDEVLYVDRVETTHHLRLHLEPGTRVPLHCTASGKLFLCRMSPEERRRLYERRPLARYTERTITDPGQLERELETTATTLIGTHDSELFADSVAIAVPVLDPSGAITAAVALHAPSSRETLDSCMRFLPVLQQAARRIGELMNTGRGPEPDRLAAGPSPATATHPNAASRRRRAAVSPSTP